MAKKPAKAPKAAKAPKETAPARTFSNVNANLEAEAFAAYSDLKAQAARINQKIAVTLARYETMDVDPAAIKFAYSLAKKSDASAIHRRNTQTAMRLGVIAWDTDANGQGDLSKALLVEKPTGEAAQKLLLGRVRADGYNTGFAGGLVAHCKHKPGSEEYVTWRDGWEMGAADRREKHPNETVAQPQPGRARRTPEQAAAEADGIGETAGSA